MKILIAADSFKDALDATSVCLAIEKGFKKVDSTIETLCVPMADGGEGSLEVISHYIACRQRKITAHDPLMRIIDTFYLLSLDGKSAYIEIAKICGLQLLLPSERNVMETTTFGLGELIKDAILQNVQNIYVLLGGSATNDGGIGMAAALGFQFLDINGEKLEGTGKNLEKIDKIIHPGNKNSFDNINIFALTDVKNPLYGVNGAAHTYAKQKGASNEEILLLDQGLKNLASKFDKKEIALSEGTGAAGGLGFGAMVFLNATILQGTTWMIDITDLDLKIQEADLIITGEGKIDGQTKNGKLVHGIAACASKYRKPVIAFCGKLEATQDEILEIGLKAAYPISENEKSHQEAILKTSENLENTAASVFKSINALF